MTEIIRFVDAVARPWVNGRGTTMVLLDDDEGSGWTYRVSVADLSGRQDFSTLPEVHRHLVFLGPGRLELVIDGSSATLDPFERVEFDGEARASSLPSHRAARDLNIMTRRGAAVARVLLTPTLDIFPQPSPDRLVAFLVALDSTCAVAGRGIGELDVVMVPEGRMTHADGPILFVEIFARESRGIAVLEVV
ncbi:MAG: HutD family protein [Actinobacteria bacterium]|nr:HutD family protein [Actinomycetota bacterium]